MFNDVFLFVFDRKINQIVFTNTKTMIFFRIYSRTFRKIFKATTLFQKLNNEYPKMKIFWLLHFFQRNFDHEKNKVLILRKKKNFSFQKQFVKTYSE